MGNRFFVKILLLLLAVIFPAIPVTADSLTENQKRKEAIERDIAILRKQIKSTTSQSEQALSSLSLIRAQILSREKLVKETDRIINSYSAQISSVQKDISNQQAVLDTLQAHYSRLVLGAYKNRDIKVWYMYILSSDNVSQAFRRFGYFKGLSSQIQTQARKIEQTQRELNTKKAELLALRAKAQKVRNQRAAELEKLRSDEKQQNNIVQKLKKNGRSFRAALTAKQNEMKAIDRQIARMLKEAASGASGSKNKKKPVDYTLSKSFENNKGKLPWPVDGPVTEHFGPYQNKELRLSLFSNGINIACEESSLVKSVFDGVVSNIMIAPGYGQCILIQHGEYYTSYCKVKNAVVRQGEKVSTGQVIGEVASIMGKTQLYFLIFNKKYIDPEAWLRER